MLLIKRKTIYKCINILILIINYLSKKDDFFIGLYNLKFNKINNKNSIILQFFQVYMGIGDWGLGIGDWGLGIGTQSPIPNPQSPIPKTFPIYNFF